METAELGLSRFGEARSLIFACLFALLSGACNPNQGDVISDGGTPADTLLLRTCAAQDILQQRLASDPEFRARRAEIAQITAEYVETVRNKENDGLRSTRAIIPVVVHVLYNDEAQNISDAQIQSQIDILNDDFRRLNADVSDVPTEFEPLIGDVRIEFQLAVRDPECNPTSGITRTQTEVEVFTTNLEDAKSDAEGGHDPWDPVRYLNIWVVPEVQAPGIRPILGYSSFPGDPAEVDGVVIGHQYFGNTGTATSPFDQGRTATHEVGHYLNLFHISGDDDLAPDICVGSDEVDDTPNQGEQNYRCPSFPSVSCMNGPNGDLFMNYMDYVDDGCMVMFTSGQGVRAAATLYGVRASLLASDALIPPPSSAAGDLFSQDSPEDIGDEPNVTSDRMYRSEDIWVRRQNDGFTNQEHENPVFRSTGEPNFVYVRIRNRGCATASSANVRLYWAKASTGLSWPAPWDGSVTSPALMGDEIDMQPTGSVEGSGFTILEFSWNPPNPADYASFGADRAHFCLLSRIENAATAPFGMTFPEGSNLSENVRSNNNVVWKNVTIAEEAGGGSREAVTTVSNFDDRLKQAALGFARPDSGEASIFTWGRVILNLGPGLYERWSEGDRQGEGVEDLGDNEIEVFGPGSFLANLPLEPGDVFAVTLRFEPRNRKPFSEVYQLDLLQYDGVPIADSLVGAQRFILKELR